MTIVTGLALDQACLIEAATETDSGCIRIRLHARKLVGGSTVAACHSAHAHRASGFWNIVGLFIVAPLLYGILFQRSSAFAYAQQAFAPVRMTAGCPHQSNDIQYASRLALGRCICCFQYMKFTRCER